MDLFGRKMDREGIRTVGTIERVVVTERGQNATGLEHAVDSSLVVYLMCRFTDQHGVVRTQETETSFHTQHIPPPGGEIELRYMPKDPTKFHTYSTGRPDPNVPRGWGAGIFEVEDLGGHHAKSLLARRTLDRQRELFRTGQRAQAEVVNVTCVDPLDVKRGVLEFSLALRAGGRDIETRARVPARCLPQPGDRIQIAVSADGSEVALDTDERYDGPPGQALVFTTPPEVAAQRPPTVSLADHAAEADSKMAAVETRNEAGMARIEAYRAGETPPSSADVTAEGSAQTGAASAPADDLVAQLSEQMAGMKRARRQMGKHYEKTVRAQLGGQRSAGLIDDATYEQLLNEALSE